MSENFAGRKFREQAFREIFLISREFNFTNQGKLCISQEFNFANGKNRYLFSPFLEKTIKIQHLSLLINKIDSLKRCTYNGNTLMWLIIGGRERGGEGVIFPFFGKFCHLFPFIMNPP